MIKIQDKTLCCGCSACAMKCPKHCISMQSDSEGFLYPIVNETDCIDCGLCEKVCHELHPYDERKPINVYAAFNKDEQVRMNSSSGGIFYLLAEKIIEEGGVVFGARFDNEWQVIIDFAETIDGIKLFMGSKYVQARTATSYIDAEAFLKQGRKVLYTGTPCQIAGLHHFLRKDYFNLITCDCVCHGAPSPKIWMRYLKEISLITGGRIDNVNFRNKDNSWSKFNTSIQTNQNGFKVVLKQYHRDNAYMKAFYMNIILRPSCYFCMAKNGRSKSDITIADYWGIQHSHPEMFDNKGTSLIFINTDRGINALDKDRIIWKETLYSDAATIYNPGISCIIKPHPKRDFFFLNQDKYTSIIALIDKVTQPSIKQRLKISIKHLIKDLISCFNCDKHLVRGGGQQSASDLSNTQN